MTTKDVLEDLIGEAKDKATRDQKRETGQTPERTFFYNTRSGRLRNVTQVRLQPGDYLSQDFRSATANREVVFGQKGKIVDASVVGKMKELCRQGHFAQCRHSCVSWF